MHLDLGSLRSQERSLTIAVQAFPDLASMTKVDSPLASVSKDVVAAALEPKGLAMPKGFCPRSVTYPTAYAFEARAAKNFMTAFKASET